MASLGSYCVVFLLSGLVDSSAVETGSTLQVQSSGHVIDNGAQQEKERIIHAHSASSKMMRKEDAAEASVMQVGLSEDPECTDPVSKHVICTLLDGTNAEVAHKLTQAISGLNIEDKGVEDIIAIEHDEDGAMTELKQEFFCLYFCAKQKSPACHPGTSNDKKIKNCRENARQILTEIQTDDAHAKDEGKKAYVAALKAMGEPKSMTQ
eukprot:CAMPEP_0169137284 /NCGR_PEP_ID=MMETSP1015-20121227/41444_1 /TAXON_ID=342587 /ORGANISM="Karlodinium micrum, Strain CCMP2283" /LENGTH=207 /DNA_ID=CAMNT_0009202093 /DNA_START=85 /DNA_END=708 /DNA_ORIENTATION=-